MNNINELADQRPLISTPNDGADKYIIIYLKFQANDYTQSMFLRFFIYFQKDPKGMGFMTHIHDSD